MAKKKPVTTKEQALETALRHIYAAHLGVSLDRNDNPDWRLEQAWNKDLNNPVTIAAIQDALVSAIKKLRQRTSYLEGVLDPLAFYIKDYLEDH